VGVVQVHVPFHCGRTLFGLDVREVHRLRVLLQGHRPVDLQALILRVKNFIGQWTDTTLRAILVAVVGELARDLLTVPHGSGHAKRRWSGRCIPFACRKSIGPRVNVQQNVQRWFTQVQ
jgi:hypothetical protein